MVLNPGVRLHTNQNMFIRAGDRAGGKYDFIFGPYLAEPKASFDDPDVQASGGVSPSITAIKKKFADLKPQAAAPRTGPAPSTMAVFSSTGSVAQPTGPAVSEEEVEVFEVQSGMTLFWGTRPKAKTRRIFIAGDGTKFLLYVLPPATPGEFTLEHVVLVDPLNSDRVRVYHLNEQGDPVGDPTILDSGHLYLRVNLDGTFTPINAVPTEIQAVVDYAKAQAAAAGAWP